MGAFCLHGNLDTCEVCRRELETDDDYAPIPTTGFAHVLPRDWPTFWQSLTPAECADALRAAPRVAGEWAQHGYGDTWTRSDVASQTCAKAFPTWYAPGNHRFAMMIGDKISDEGFATITEAKSAADAALIAQGWVLL